MPSGVAKPIDKTKQRKTHRTPWAIYNPQWIKSWQRRGPTTPETKR